MKDIFEVKDMMKPAFEYFRNLGRRCGEDGDYGEVVGNTLEEKLESYEDLRDYWKNAIETKDFGSFSSNGYVRIEALDSFKETAYFYALIGEEDAEDAITLGCAEDIAEKVTNWIVQAAFLAEMDEYVRLLDERIEGIKQNQM